MAESLSYTEKLKKWDRFEVEKFSKKAPVTTPYPFIDIEKPPEYRGIPHINPEKCIGCGACVNACPPDALILEWDKEHGVKRLTFNAARCIRCHRCVEVCPTGAMEPTTRFEIATDNKEDLVEVVEHKLAYCEECGEYLDFTERQIEYVRNILPKEIFEMYALEDRLGLTQEAKMRKTVEKLRETEGIPVSAFMLVKKGGDE
ncbi:4Fe-4S dicluster domain-containing protein [Thermococcus henrietii]|uniref:4Fe-4S dicluster domain-containing protein n=1 Tax=Thermococcus henrietii TaxID=2016361 RepID=UPI000C0858FA|nr:4Fe-4S dicluster domain-containing protein [Thermococcus henrietii]